MAGVSAMRFLFEVCPTLEDLQGVDPVTPDLARIVVQRVPATLHSPGSTLDAPLQAPALHKPRSVAVPSQLPRASL